MTKFQCENLNAEDMQGIAIIVEKGTAESISLDPLRGEMRDMCRRIAVNANFSAEEGSLLTIPTADRNVRYVFISGVDGKEYNKNNALRTASFRAARAAAERGVKTLSITIEDPKDAARSAAVAEGAALASYRFHKYKTKNEHDNFCSPEQITIAGADPDSVKQGVISAEAQMWARDIENEPGNRITPSALAEEARKLADKFCLEYEVWDEKRIEAEKMGAYFAVGSGSANKPRFIRLTYTPKCTPKGHIVIVGKGLTFDSGGLNIKPDSFMLTMKGDKSGACCVFAAIAAAAQLDLPWKVTALSAAAENMPGGSAYRPDDILRARNGKTIEVNNTDAEGRLTLADALCCASEMKPDCILDIATLTGACAVALGNSTAGVFTNNQEFADKLLAAAKRSGESFWQLPMTDPNLRKQIKSPFADLVNSAGRYGGAITAAMFLEAFVDKDIPWIHLDIAGTDFVENPFSYYVKGATGFGTRTIIELLKGL
ncbi:MAG: leucyl aminopeptidase [Synergistes sp.]|nr:leucyl aminopeptidase [Synergistes sp.]